MHRRVFILFVAILGIAQAFPSKAETIKNVELFGVPIMNASRDQLRQVFEKNGIEVVREDNKYWVDTYNASRVLDGATNLEVGYVSATGKFAYAEYTFPGFMDTQLVSKIINMVSTKYGRPSSQSGSYGLGEVTAKWNMGKGMEIVVSRGWPDTTTYLTYKDITAYGQMRAEINAEEKAKSLQKAKAQSNAF